MGLDAGHSGWRSLAGGIVAWSSADLPILRDAALTDEQHERYSRQLLLPDVGVTGQLQLLIDSAGGDSVIHRSDVRGST